MAGDSGQALLGTHNGELRIEYENGRLIVSDAGVDILLLGRDDEGNIVGKLSEAGVDVKTAPESQLIWSSTKKTFEVLEVINTPFSLTSGGVNPSSATVDAVHNQSNVPLSLSAVRIDTLTNGSPGLYPIPFFTPGTGGGTTNVFVMLSYLRVRNVNSSYIRYEFGIQAPSQTFAGTITTYILKEPINV
jgi:hypothetical protein